MKKMAMGMPAFERATILVVGDVMLDRYWQGPSCRISPEAPVPVISVDEKIDRLGGAANVATNLAKLGCKVTLMGIVGNDEAGMSVRNLVSENNIKHQLQVSQSAPTVTKLRVLSRHQQLLRMDFEAPFSKVDSVALLERFKESLDGIDIVLISDYAKGSVQDTQAFIQAAAARAIPVFVDPKTGRYDRYRHANLLTPNMHEFEQVVGPCINDADMVKKGMQLIEDLQLQSLLITRGEKGISLLRPSYEPVHLPAHAREVYDVTGAGDTVIAVLAGALAAGKDIVESVQIANLAAAIVVSKSGTATVLPHELRDAIKGLTNSKSSFLNEESLIEAVKDARLQGERIVFTNGCFDLLHAGHVSYLSEAKQLGDKLIVAVNSDESVRALKGATRPINCLNDRMLVLTGLAAVDWVVPFEDATPERLLELIKPDVLAKGGDYTYDQVVGHEIVTGYGGEVVVLGLTENKSTSSMVNKIQNLQ